MLHSLRNATALRSLGVYLFLTMTGAKRVSVSLHRHKEHIWRALSAYLYEMTGNLAYQDSAKLAHTFTQSHLYDATRGCITDNYNIQQCQTQNDWAFTYDTGLYLEGLSVLANTTKDSGLIQLADQIALDSMKSPLWTNVSGVIKESMITWLESIYRTVLISIPFIGRSNVKNDNIGHWFKGMLIRALHEHWSRSESGSGIANLIESFLTVQHNAILNLAKYPGSDWYTPTWAGPPVPIMLPWGQLAAMDVLSSAISFALNITDTNTNTTSPITQEFSASHKTPLGAVIGGAVGGSLVLILVIGIIFMRLRTRHSALSTKAIVHKPEALGESARRVSSDPSQSIDPFPPPSPPPFPIIEHFHSSKLPHEDRPPASVAIQSNSQPSSQPGVAHLSTPPQNRQSENIGTRQDPITEMIHHLNQALTSLAEGALPATTPPRYEDI
ncbi:hypothetical protein QCA50_008139 [Cerrena zonata]|uniref:Glycoside hydrolase family 76 protein n=1 Tax=Cerrena zonata TaxID=2478898 RepID=A0AAW0G778_9APHY